LSTIQSRGNGHAAIGSSLLGSNLDGTVQNPGKGGNVFDHDGWSLQSQPRGQATQVHLFLSSSVSSKYSTFTLQSLGILFNGFSHAVDSLLGDLPTGQVEHEIWPLMFWKRPGWHWEQNPEFWASPCVPGSQPRHTELPPSSNVVVPSGHGVHAEASNSSDIQPCGHSEHSPVGEKKVPPLQG